ncbi:hypothetical protein AB0E96_30575 [Kitasatospora sp. NPDC036755]|uniref:hypothetical protein n=1 Tax=Kitasatospora sp. NPDC036755 TaxID=3154600 RepID=UPI0033E91EBF
MKRMMASRRRGAATGVLMSVPAALLLATGCGAGSKTAATEQGVDRRPTAVATTPAQVRTDLEPLTRRFPQLGSLSAAMWVDRVLTQNSVTWVPGPTDVSVQGVAQVEPATLAEITGKGTWEEVSIGCGVPQEIAAEVGDPTRWLHSRAFDESVTRTQYSGSFYFDRQASRVYFCTVNPKIREES